MACRAETYDIKCSTEAERREVRAREARHNDGAPKVAYEHCDPWQERRDYERRPTV